MENLVRTQHTRWSERIITCGTHSNGVTHRCGVGMDANIRSKTNHKCVRNSNPNSNPPMPPTREIIMAHRTAHSMAPCNHVHNVCACVRAARSFVRVHSCGVARHKRKYYEER